MEPLPKQGCEGRSDGLRIAWTGLSGTLAEAGVRAGQCLDGESAYGKVSVEPLPKQGCEYQK